MRVRPLAAVAGITAIATLTAGATVAATTAQAAARAGTNLSIREARQLILVGQSNVISGQLRGRGEGALPKETVQLLARDVDAADWTKADSTLTDERGVARFEVSPTQTTRYELSFLGDDAHFASQSGVVRTAVAQHLPTAIGIAVDKHSLSPGQSADIRGRLHLARRTRHPRGVPDQQVIVEQQLSDNTWQAVASGTTGRYGVVHFSVAPAQTTRYAIFFDGTSRLGASRSHGITISIGAPTTLSITTSAASVNPGETVTVSGVLTENGQPLGGQSVELRARAAHGHSDFTTVATGTTATDGSVSFQQSPTADTIYRLLFRHTDRAASSASPAAEVLVRRPTSLSIRADGDTIRGALFGPRNNPLPRKSVTLQSSPAGAGTWDDIGSDMTGPHGGVAFAVSPTATTDYRLVFTQTSRFEAGQSGIVTSSS